MKENILIIKDWNLLSKTRLRHFLIQLVTSLIEDFTLMFAAIPAANIIVNLNKGNYSASYFWLSIGFIILFSRQIARHLKYLNQ